MLIRKMAPPGVSGSLLWLVAAGALAQSFQERVNVELVRVELLATDRQGAVWLVRSGRVRLKPSAYQWSFAVRDEQTGITTYLTFDRALP